MQKMRYKDSAEAPIIAFDFDGTVNINGEDCYPKCGELRPFADDVINFLTAIGCKVVMWTSRDVAYNQDNYVVYDHFTEMINFLKDNNVNYSAINKSIQFAPYYYNGRKIYAHLYVDDRAFGWRDTDDVMIKVLQKVGDILGVPNEFREEVCQAIYSGTKFLHQDIIDKYRKYVEEWKD